MISDPTFATPTMARIQAAQGNLGAAADIYRYLLCRQPERADLTAALAEVERRLTSRNTGELAGLLEHWVELLVLRRHLARLSALRSVDKPRRLP